MSGTQNQYDYLIVGQGIAGTVLAFTLLRQGSSAYVVDLAQEHSTSKVAAGLFNPITGRKMNKTWLAESLFPALHEFYPWLEKEVGASFFYPTPIYVPFDSVEKQNDWLGKSASDGYEAFVKGFVPHKYEEALNGGFGGMEMKGSGFINTRTMLAACREYLVAKGILQEGFIDPLTITLHEDSISWQGIKAKKVIFCEGVRNRLNPYFEWLDYRPAKGEILEVELANAPFKEIINRGCWLIRQEDGSFRVGSNFERTTDPEPSYKGKEQVLEKLHALTPLAYAVKGHQAGIRPATYDRRPFIGLHPQYPPIGLFGGLGSKGTSLAPYLATHFVDYLEKDMPLMPEVELNRKQKKKG